MKSTTAQTASLRGEKTPKNSSSIILNVKQLSCAHVVQRRTLSGLTRWEFSISFVSPVTILDLSLFHTFSWYLISQCSELYTPINSLQYHHSPTQTRVFRQHALTCRQTLPATGDKKENSIQIVLNLPRHNHKVWQILRWTQTTNKNHKAACCSKCTHTHTHTHTHTPKRTGTHHAPKHTHTQFGKILLGSSDRSLHPCSQLSLAAFFFFLSFFFFCIPSSEIRQM